MNTHFGMVMPWRCFLLCTLCWPFFIRNGTTEEPQRARHALYEQLKQASAEVLVDRRLAGSGCIVDEEGLVLTAAHVVPRVDATVEVITPSAGRVTAKIVAIDQGHDLALLQLPKRELGYQSLSLAERTPQVGDSAFLFGAPLFRHHILIRGSVARTGTVFEYVNGHYVEVIHVCGVTAKGLSGGPWVNEGGEVFGVQSSAMSLGDAQQGIAFVSPRHAVQRLIAARQSVSTPTAGTAVEEIWEQPPKFLASLATGVQGLVARQVKPNGPAATVGIQDAMIITTVDDVAVQYRDECIRAIRRKKVGDSIKLTILDATGQKPRAVIVCLESLE